jgi:hypothetical protein
VVGLEGISRLVSLLQHTDLAVVTAAAVLTSTLADACATSVAVKLDRAALTR